MRLMRQLSVLGGFFISSHDLTEWTVPGDVIAGKTDHSLLNSAETQVEFPCLLNLIRTEYFMQEVLTERKLPLGKVFQLLVLHGCMNCLRSRQAVLWV